MNETVVTPITVKIEVSGEEARIRMPVYTDQRLLITCPANLLPHLTFQLERDIYKNPNCTIDHPGSSCNVACGY